MTFDVDVLGDVSDRRDVRFGIREASSELTPEGHRVFKVNGRPILVRFIWSDITDRTCRWEQSFSPDGGTTWEVNWIMESSRIA